MVGTPEPKNRNGDTELCACPAVSDVEHPDRSFALWKPRLGTRRERGWPFWRSTVQRAINDSSSCSASVVAAPSRSCSRSCAAPSAKTAWPAKDGLQQHPCGNLL